MDQQPELLLALLQRILGSLAFAQIARDLGEANDFTCRVADRNDDHVCPEARAVLADPPAFAFELPFVRGGLEREGRNPLLPIFLGVEPGKVLTDDFRRRISLEALCARIPTCHDAAGVQHVDGIVRHRFNQETITTIIRH